MVLYFCIYTICNIYYTCVTVSTVGKEKLSSSLMSIVYIYIYISIIISSATAARCRHDERWVLGSEKNFALKASVRRKEECLSRPVCSTYKEVISPGVEFPSRARAHRFFFRSPYASLASIFFFLAILQIIPLPCPRHLQSFSRFIREYRLRRRWCIYCKFRKFIQRCRSYCTYLHVHNIYIINVVYVYLYIYLYICTYI
uniref:Uncharacterized protein n=1 Tax=Schizaphis graminum TaxID=13262 RepID=A0A2S2PSR5_SCHGA